MELINLEELYTRCGYEGDRPDVKYPPIAVAHVIGELLGGMGYAKDSLIEIVATADSMGEISCDVKLWSKKTRKPSA